MPGIADILFGPRDAASGSLGAMLDAAGYGPVESPFKVAWSASGVVLRDYSPAGASGPVLLIVPAPIKRSYIWDLCPDLSAVRRCVEAGFRVYLMHWTPPGRDLGLADFAERLIQGCADAIATQAGERQVLLAGHSLGGTLAALFASLYPERVRRLLLIDAPVCFGPGSGDLKRLVDRSPSVRPLTGLSARMPGSLMDEAAFAASPPEYIWRPMLDWMRSLNDPDALRLHLRVRCWTREQLPMPPSLFEQIVEWLYREDRFMRDELALAGRPARPDNIEMPVLSVADELSRVVPAAAFVPFHERIRSSEKHIFWYRPDVGVALGHVGALVGRAAHRTLWPQITGWLGGRIDGDV